MSMDIAKKQLEKLDTFVQGLQQELVTLAQYTDVGPSRALYAHIRELIKELIDEQDPNKFAQKFQGVNQAVAGILIVLVPASAGKVARNMQKAHGQNFDPSQFSDLVKDMNQNINTNVPQNPTDPVNPEDEDFIVEDEPKVENKAEDVISMLGLEKHVKPKAQPGKNDTLGGVFEKYNNEQ
ncbi:hypothetical protein D3C76_974820 [compost metagenome]